MTCDLTVVIVSYNTRELTLNAIRSFRAATGCGCQYSNEIIVVDNDSRDGTVAAVSRAFPDVVLIASPDNLGYGRAGNLGYAASRGRYLLFANPDVEVYPGTLATLVRTMDRMPWVGACTPFLELMNGELDLGAHRGRPTLWSALTHLAGLGRLCRRSRRLSRIFGRYHLLDRDFALAHPVDVIEGGFFFVRREVFELAGRWDEDYFLFGEDIDLCCRIAELGRCIMFFPGIRARHLLGGSTGLKPHSRGHVTVSTEDRLRAYDAFFDSMKIFYDKHHRRRHGGLVRGLVFVAIECMRRCRRRRLTV